MVVRLIGVVITARVPTVTQVAVVSVVSTIRLTPHDVRLVPVAAVVVVVTVRVAVTTAIAAQILLRISSLYIKFVRRTVILFKGL